MAFKLTSQEFEKVLAAQPVAADSPITSPDSPLLGQLASLDRHLLDRFVTEERYEPGTVLFKDGDPGDAMYVIRSGQIAVVKGDLSAPTVLSYWGPGSIVGEMALLQDQPRSASVVATQDLRVLRISCEGFRQVLDSSPEIEKSIMEAVSSRLRASDDLRAVSVVAGRKLSDQVSELQAERQQLIEFQRVRQEASDLIARDLRIPIDTLRSTVHILEIVLPKEAVDANRELLEAAKLASRRMRQLMDSLRHLTTLWPVQLTVLFADVSDFSVVSGEMDAGDVSQVMETLWQQLRQLVLEYGGLVDRQVGDSMLALWGAETVHEDDAKQSVRAALALRDKLADFCAAQHISLSVRIGINTGPVLLGAAGTTREYAEQGITISTARRLGNSAPAGGIVISEDTCQHVKDAFDVKSHQPVHVDEQAEPVATYLVERAELPD